MEKPPLVDGSKFGNLAILIDGDNAQPVLIGAILLEAARYGRPTIRRIYGDWTSPNMSAWKSALHDHAISPVQQFRNTVGKNATDCTMIIDAMDILNSRTVSAFCIVSSDSDYTRLALRIREDGILVIGIGKQTTPQAFVKACDVFVNTNLLLEQPILEKPPAIPLKSLTPEEIGISSGQKPGKLKEPAPNQARPVEAAKPASTAKKGANPPPLNLLQKAFEMSVQEDGRAHLGQLGASLRQIDPAFDPRAWGYTQLSQMIDAAKTRFVVSRGGKQGNQSVHVSLRKIK